MKITRTELLSLFCFLLAGTVGADDGWEILFNGKDLAGWRGTVGGGFTVVDGTIRANAKSKQMDHLYYVGDLKEGYVSFKNFELERYARSEVNSNSGVYFHTDTSPRNKRYMLMDAIQRQVQQRSAQGGHTAVLCGEDICRHGKPIPKS